MRNKYDYSGKCLKSGTEAEKRFLELALSKGLEATASNGSDQLKHVDVWIEKDGEKYGIDVKAQKKINRADANSQDELCWIEIRGVRKSGSSWLIDGISKFIAFEREDHYMIVDRLELIELVTKICDLKTFVTQSKNALYKSYRRKEREGEHLTIIKYSDMSQIKHSIWQKSS